MTENPAPAERGEAPRWQIGRLAALGVTTARAVRLYEAAGAARGAGGDLRWPGMRERLGRLRDAPAPPGRVTYQRPGAGSTHAAGDVGLGALVGRVLEDLLGAAVLDEHARAGVALGVREH